MITDRTIEAWKTLLDYAIGASTSVLTGVPIQLRDSEEVKTYPGIYLAESSVDRVEAGGVKDSNAYRITINTMLVTTPGDDDDEATSKDAHSSLRNALSGHISNPLLQGWLNACTGITCFDLQVSAPSTTEEDGYRVTTWPVDFTVC
jgi:hypothetical protein